MALSSQLEDFLDRDIFIAPITSEVKLRNEEKNLEIISYNLNLFSNTQIESQSNKSNCSSNGKKKLQKFTDLFHSRQKQKVFANDEEVLTKCKDLALTPEDILSGRGVYPFLHPKNTRCIERYRKVKTLRNGTVIAVALENVEDESGNEEDSTWSETEALKRVTPRSGPVLDIENLRSTKLCRKQKRKRGIKKKNV